MLVVLGLIVFSLLFPRITRHLLAALLIGVM
jgi:hypothetical protein